MPPVIVARKVAKSYGSFEALRNASFHIPRGAITGLIGPNGSGKTTTIKLLVGLLKRDKGELEVLGHDPWLEESEVRSRVGVLHEKPLYPIDERVDKLLRHIARMRGAPLSEVERLLRLTGLSGYAGVKVRALSRGYLQRLGIAIALVGDPELLLLDEPTANLDPGARREVLNLVKALREELDATFVISSHLIPELQEICDYAVFIQGGVVLDHGNVSELAKRYGVTAYYVVTATNLRLLASELIKQDFVEGVELGDAQLILRVRGDAFAAAEAALSRLAGLGLVRSYEFRTASLSELYSKVVAQ